MKRMFILLSFAAMLVLSCIPDERDNYMVSDSLSLVYARAVTEVSVYDGSCTVTVEKAGKGKSSAVAKLSLSAEALAAYNEANGTAYVKVPDTHGVVLSEETLRFGVSDVRKTITVSWDKDKCSLLEGDNYVIPVEVISGTDGINVNAKRSLLLLNVLRSSVSFAMDGSKVVAKKNAAENGELNVKINLDRPLAEDLTVNCVVDNAFIPVYNATYLKGYVAAPDGLVEIDNSTAVIGAGAYDTQMKLVIHTDKLFGTGGVMTDFSTYLVPLKIGTVSKSGVGISDKIYYLRIRSPFAAPTFERIWGLYSKNGKAWTDAYSLLDDGVDRSLALDDKYLYVPYCKGGSVARIVAISLTDPASTKEVNTEGFKTNTITSACVRVIDKGNGTGMLTACGANESKFMFYAWENGIDAPPTVFELGCTWRRHGDRYEFNGTWKKGQLWVHSYQGTFSSYYEVENGGFVKVKNKDFLLVDIPYEGFGGVYWYPGSDEMLFASTNAGAYLKLTGEDHVADVFIVLETTKTAFPEARYSYGYHYFKFNGVEYIAFVRFDPDDTFKRARLVVVQAKGSFASSLGTNETIVYEAPLQGENFTDISVLEAGNKQADCAVYLSSDNVLIAAGAQGIGVSLFNLE